MLQSGYIVGQFNHNFAVSTPLARLLHCLCESVACPMAHLLLVIRDWVRTLLPRFETGPYIRQWI